MITPSLPTCSKASAIWSPITGSLLAEMEATAALSARVLTLRDWASIELTATSTALSIPFRMPIVLTPVATYLRPSAKIAEARTVAVVVPSPATSLVLFATSFTSLAPMFSKGSSSSTSLETETPSFVTCGPPKDFWRMTLRPAGPSVTRTVLASFSMPLFIF